MCMHGFPLDLLDWRGLYGKPCTHFAQLSNEQNKSILYICNKFEAM